MNEKVLKEMDDQPREIRARFERIVKLIEANGLEQVREPYIKHLEDKLWEMRMKGKNTIARALYLTVVGKKIVIVRVFTKKTKKTPRREIKTALSRMQELEE